MQSRAGAPADQVIPGSWDTVAALRTGSPVVVTLTDGARVEAAFTTLGPIDLVLTDSAGGRVAVPRTDVRQIVAGEEPDDLLDGTLIGAGIGLGTAAAVLAILASGEGYVLASAKWGVPLLLSGVGGVIGVFVDRARTEAHVVYVSP
jgi:hypothetical protein